jgi:hypothetical protein
VSDIAIASFTKLSGPPPLVGRVAVRLPGGLLLHNVRVNYEAGALSVALPERMALMGARDTSRDRVVSFVDSETGEAWCAEVLRLVLRDYGNKLSKQVARAA